MSVNDTDANHTVGTIAEVAKDLYDELLTTGSSLMLTNVIKILVRNTEKYAGWSGELQHCPASDSSCTKPLIAINENTVLGVDDWLIIEPVVRAHCGLVQARRMEGAQNLGVQPIGMSSSEAKQEYKEALEQMKKEAFQFQPFSIEIPNNQKTANLPWLWNL